MDLHKPGSAAWQAPAHIVPAMIDNKAKRFINGLRQIKFAKV
jgi:hypothetical protein